MPLNIDCPRKLQKCEALGNVVSDAQGDDRSFICVGYNEPESRKFDQDKFRHCWFAGGGTEVDIMQDMDVRDLIDTISVMAQALSIDENIRVAEHTPDRTEK